MILYLLYWLQFLIVIHFLSTELIAGLVLTCTGQKNSVNDLSVYCLYKDNSLRHQHGHMHIAATAPFAPIYVINQITLCINHVHCNILSFIKNATLTHILIAISIQILTAVSIYNLIAVSVHILFTISIHIQILNTNSSCSLNIHSNCNLNTNFNCNPNTHILIAISIHILTVILILILTAISIRIRIIADTSTNND